jgi:NADH-quinone oxidoreductase subunit J
MLVLFYLFSALLILFALGTVISTNLIHSALLMIGAFFAVSGIYLLLQADFLAMVQILVYVGAIAILMVFGVMLTRKGSIEESNLPNRYKWIAVLTSLGLFSLLARSIYYTHFPSPPAGSNTQNILLLAQTFLLQYFVAFEAIGVLLLIAIIGAIIIGKESK